MEPRHHEQISPVIRPARGEDSRAMAQVYVDAWRETYPVLLPLPTLLSMSADRWERQFGAIIAGGREVVLVAEDRDHGVIGMATGGRALDTGLAVDGARVTGEIFTLYVAPDHTGRGAGQGLLQSLLRRLAERGHPHVVAWMLKDNPTRFFYERNGAKLIAAKRERRFGVIITLEAYAWRDLDWLAPRRSV